MITGFNTDIEFNGRVFHVQTEDRGVDNPIVESLVYSGGAIVTSRKMAYSDLLEPEGCDEDELHHRMEVQHRELIRAIRNGELSPGELKPFGHGVVTNRPFDEVVRGFLLEHSGLDGLRMRIVAPRQLLAGDRPTLKLEVADGTGTRPVAGASVVARVQRVGAAVLELWATRSDADGRVETTLEVPAAGAFVVFEAEAAGQRTRLECPVRPRKAQAPA
jgi:hypothetical protein